MIVMGLRVSIYPQALAEQDVQQLQIVDVRIKGKLNAVDLVVLGLLDLVANASKVASMGYVVVTAELPGITPDQRTLIDECLKKKDWVKATEFTGNIPTVWHRHFPSEFENRAIEITKENFRSCCQPYCKPKLVLHWGRNGPIFSGLV